MTDEIPISLTLTLRVHSFMLIECFENFLRLDRNQDTSWSYTGRNNKPFGDKCDEGVAFECSERQWHCKNKTHTIHGCENDISNISISYFQPFWLVWQKQYLDTILSNSIEQKLIDHLSFNSIQITAMRFQSAWELCVFFTISSFLWFHVEIKIQKSAKST